MDIIESITCIHVQIEIKLEKTVVQVHRSLEPLSYTIYSKQVGLSEANTSSSLLYNYE